MAHYRPNNNIPPVSFELTDIKINSNDPDYATAVRAVKGYQRQAVNMTLAEQHDYIHMIQLKDYKIFPSGRGVPGNHKIYKSCKKDPTWPKFVLVHSIYDDATSLNAYVGSLGSDLTIRDYTSAYRDSLGQPNEPVPPTVAFAPIQPTNAFAPFQPTNPVQAALASVRPAQPTTTSQTNLSLMTPVATPGTAISNPVTIPITPTKRKATSQGQRQPGIAPRQPSDQVPQAPQPLQDTACPTTTNNDANNRGAPRNAQAYHQRLRQYLDNRFDKIEKSISELKTDTKASLDEIKKTLMNDPYAD